MNTKEKYETVIGLEVHIQLSTKSKAYCGDLNLFGETPNSCVSAISLGYPGTLPKPNHEVIKHAIRLGLALNCNITKHNVYARKNYFYPDLPKGYQITQDKTPICTNGYVNIGDKTINLTRIHMEEDAGKSIHDLDPFHSLIDLNRAGVPLLEIVSEPEIRSSEEAQLFMQEIRKLIRYIGVSNGNMEEGSMRCDANISIRPKGSQKLRNRVEVKNINSFKNVGKAIELERERQIHCYENNLAVEQETRNYNAPTNSTTVLRSKEDAQDYRYFVEPDIQPIIIEKKFIETIKKEMPLLPKDLYDIYTEKYKLSDYDANVLIEEKQLSDLFNQISKHTIHYKTSANLIMGTIKSYINEKSIPVNKLNISIEHLSELIEMIASETISHLVVSQKLFPEMVKPSSASPKTIARQNQWLQEINDDMLEDLINKAMKKHPEKVIAYQQGNHNLLGLFMGEVMKTSTTNLNPKLVNTRLQIKLKA
jgi:aspartyl-tRNA(Asn)/glutamyl-tRNA(Gln) amidotransferase subunit B